MSQTDRDAEFISDHRASNMESCMPQSTGNLLSMFTHTERYRYATLFGSLLAAALSVCMLVSTETQYLYGFWFLCDFKDRWCGYKSHSATLSHLAPILSVCLWAAGRGIQDYTLRNYQMHVWTQNKSDSPSQSFRIKMPSRGRRNDGCCPSGAKEDIAWQSRATKSAEAEGQDSWMGQQK